MQLDSYFVALIFREILGMPQDSKASDVRGSVGLVFQHKTSSVAIQTSHTAHGFVHHILGLLVRNDVIFLAL